MAREDELLEEIDKLKKDMQNHHLMLQMLIGGGTAVNKRLDVIETLAITTSKIAATAFDIIKEHLDALGNLGKPPAESSSAKKESHPEFG